ncbi:autotransporter outer membrane beta-barrel domain-containing protein [Microbulbifer bruguierae]|uniref:Autotransporter outer membrane beta-barrel domain-containing protein n=1 Tax=Microbulbifer bruguierae TaxID=3029061 RepID=A0ABY8NCM1_9GAMM|nr:autotransporter outer membrane beta-barrel domain-containing protein [Microbulbifer bruguierae]WGL15817.1 autotransporter outer membrane beta-barrel domain-containing protein [Microbulbifer bruguierae]
MADAQITLGNGDDQYTLTSGSFAAHSSTQIIDGGGGSDRLTVQGLNLSNPGRLLNWESIRLQDSTTLELGTSLSLGGVDALPTSLTIDTSSSILLPHASAAILPSAGQSLTVVNHGVIDLRGDTANGLLIDGDYQGTGIIHMDLMTAGNDSLADRLVINSGHASGNTQLLFNQFGSAGTSDGILVVEARNGGTTASHAFYMSNSVSAGPYEYFLFRGNGNPADAQNWYLRSTLLPGDVPATAPEALVISNFDVVTAPAGVTAADIASANLGAPPEAAAGRPDLLAAAPPAGSAPITLYRPETPLYAQAKSLARLSSLQEIGSYHKRRGEQRNWFDGASKDWLRIHHTGAAYNWSGDVGNRFDGNITGFQLGTNLWSAPTCTGSVREMGLFFGSTQARGDTTGFARGFTDYRAGENQLTSTHIGYYFNDYQPDMGYLDFTAKIAYLKLASLSSRDIGDTTYGPQLTVSVEKGITWQMSEQLALEPQAQVVVNYSNLSAFSDGISWVEPDMTPEANFRLGLRGYNLDSDAAGLNLRFYLFGNIWHTLGGSDELVFDNRLQVNLERQATWGEFGGGLVLLEHKLGSAFFNVGYQRSLDDLDWSGGSANLGFNWAW